MATSKHSVVLVLLMMLSGCSFPGQRLLHLEISVDGEIQLEGMRGVPDSTPIEKMWDILPEVEFAASEKATGQTADSQSNLEELSGEVTVTIFHGDSNLASSTVQSLSLSPNPDGSGWILQPGELDRLKGAAR